MTSYISPELGIKRTGFDQSYDFCTRATLNRVRCFLLVHEPMIQVKLDPDLVPLEYQLSIHDFLGNNLASRTYY